jgi:hypothetical protein
MRSLRNSSPDVSNMKVLTVSQIDLDNEGVEYLAEAIT